MVDRKTKGRLRNKILGRPFLLIEKGVNDVTLLRNCVTLPGDNGVTFDL